MAVDTISQFLGLRTDTPASQCPAGYSPDCSDVVFLVNEVSTRTPFRKKLSMPSDVVYDESFTGRDGNTYRIVVDINGAMWSVAADGTHTQIDQVAAGSSVNGVTAYGRQYMAFFNANGGCDAPRQWDGKNLYRVAQGGPGAAATFTATALTSDKYPITSIKQPASQSRGSSYFLQSSGPGSTAPGNIVTAYYSDSTLAGPDADLEAAFNSGFPVYVYFSFTGGPSEQGPYTVLVTGIGKASPPTQPREFYYFTFQVPTTAYVYYQGSGNPGYTANYQRTLATILTSAPVPGVSIGETITVSETSVSNWNADWPVQQTPLSGNLVITQTSLTAGIATYNYSVVSGVSPTAGQKITVTGTLNAGGTLNVTEKAIATASGGEIGSFTISGFTGSDFPPATESGSGITDGTEFLIEPALPVVGTSTSPIYPASAGGFLVFAGTAAIISAGKRQAVVFFITDTDFNTAPGPIASFTIPANTGAIAVSGLPIGPPNVKQRVVALTPANGSRFFAMLLPDSVNGTITGTSTVINDNTSDTATLVFTDIALQDGIAIDITGNNQFQQVTLDTPSGVQWYADRLFWKGGRNKVTNLVNMEMDGGTLTGSSNPLGWEIIGSSGSIQQVGSAPAYVVAGPGTGEISQPAATTLVYGSPILQPKQTYSLRLWTNGTSGSAVGTISSASTGFSSTATVALSPGYAEADFTLEMPADIPSDLEFDFKIEGLVAGISAAVRDLQLVYASNPNRNPIARASYASNPEAYDQGTGNIGPSDDNSELRAMFVLEESFHFLTARGLYFVQSIGNSEPSSWEPKQISIDCPAFNANSVAVGQGWAVWGGDLGFFKYGVWFPGYLGGTPENLSNIIAPTWRGVAGITRVYNDPNYQRIYIGTESGMLVLDYHELLQQGPMKWTKWARTPGWISSNGFSIGSNVYQLDTVAGTTDDDLGDIGGYYTLSPFASSVMQKLYSYLAFQISGSGPLTPFLYTKTLQDAAFILNASELSTLLDTVAEWNSLSLRGRLLFLKLGQPGVAFDLQQVSCSYGIDPNAPYSGTR